MNSRMALGMTYLDDVWNKPSEFDFVISRIALCASAGGVRSERLVALDVVEERHIAGATS